MIHRILLAAAAAVIVVIAGCTSQPASPPATTSSRYPNSTDGAPLRAISPEDVQDAVLSADPLLSAGNKSPYSVNGVSYNILQQYQGYRQQGIASWYGTKFHGHETSNGEIYDLYQASAAHKTLPIPCFARVTNLSNGKSVVVRVNDRGPFHSDRLIDLSYGAAVKLGYMESGTAPVEVTVLDVPGVDDRRDIAGGDYRYLQLGAFGTRDSARRLQLELQQVLTAPVEISKVQAGPGLLYRVRVGPLASGDELQGVQRLLIAGGYGSGQPLP